MNFNPLIEEILRNPIKIDIDGYVKIPNKPGLGIDIDPKALEKYL